MRNKLAHTVWECKYHVVWIPKCRRKVIYGKLRKEIGSILRRLCEYKGVEIVEASDGRQALEITKTQQFAAIFSDMEMPHISGMELLAEINSDAHEDPPPVVIISSRSEAEFTDRAKELGANNYLIKPLADEALDGALREIPLLRHLPAISPTQLQPCGEIQ